MSGTSDLHVETIDSASAFASIEGEWSALRRSVGNDLPFDSHRWLSAWWRACDALAPERRLRVILARRGTRLVGALPVQFERGRFRGLPVSRAFGMGSGWGATSPLIERDDTRAIARALFAELGTRRTPAWQVLHFLAMRVDDDMREAVLDAARAAGFGVRPGSKFQPFLPLHATWEQYLAGQSRNFRRTIKRKQQATAAAGLSARTISNPTPEDFHRLVHPVTAVSWQGAQGLAVTATEFGKRFYDELARGTGEFDVDLVAIEHAEGAAAFLVGLKVGRTYHAFETGFDPRWNEQSPGLMIHYVALERLHGEGFAEFDFGHPSGYKARFEPQQRAVLDLWIFRSRLLEGWDRLARWLDARRTARTAAPEPRADDPD